MVWLAAMIWFWLGFFALVALLLSLDLGVLHRRAAEPSLRSAVGWTIGWICLGLSFAGVVYLIYEHAWLGARMASAPSAHGARVAPIVTATGVGSDAAITYVSAYLLEQALSIDNIFVMSLLFRSFRVPAMYQHRVLFWGILGAIGFRITMLGGGAYLAKHFTWVFYVFGSYLEPRGPRAPPVRPHRRRRSRRQVHGADRRPPRADHRRGVPRRDRADRYRVRARLDPGGAVGEPGHLHHRHVEHLRDHGAAVAVLRARRRDGQVPVPEDRARRAADPDRHQAVRSQLVRRPARGVARGDRRHHRHRRDRLGDLEPAQRGHRARGRSRSAAVLSHHRVGPASPGRSGITGPVRHHRAWHHRVGPTVARPSCRDRVEDDLGCAARSIAVRVLSEARTLVRISAVSRTAAHVISRR
ncbi:MAG: hypothetical protein E6J91_19560, partial [Deltaproteobacteria bacterium]